MWVKLIWETHYEGRSITTWQVGCFWWKGIIKFIAKCTVGQDNYIMLWQDSWSDTLLKHKSLELFSFTLHEDISIKEHLDKENLVGNFHTPLCLQAYEQSSNFRFWSRTFSSTNAQKYFAATHEALFYPWKSSG